MTRPSRQQERITQITAMLDVSPALRLRDLAAQMGVTEMTLRRDAAQAGGRFACRGGYLVASRTTEYYDFDAQMTRAIEAKRAAAQIAQDLVPDQAVVFLDAGTTLPHLARLLAQGGVRRIITHCFTTAEVLQGRANVPVEFLGGEIKLTTRSCHAENPQERLADLGIDVAFLSAGGIDAAGVISCSYPYEAALKQAAIASSAQSYVVLDDSKLGTRKPVPFATLDAVDGVVSETGLWSGAQMRNRLTQLSPREM